MSNSQSKTNSKSQEGKLYSYITKIKDNTVRRYRLVEKFPNLKDISFLEECTEIQKYIN